MKPCPICGSTHVDYETCGQCLCITCYACGCSTRPVLARTYRETLAAKATAYSEWERICMHQRRDSQCENA